MEIERKKILLDCGTSYAKILHLSDGAREILPAKKLISAIDQYEIVAATGHNTAMFKTAQTINELVALARGGLAVIGQPDFTLLDCGARDIKYIKVKNNRVDAMDWNTECGAFTGQVIELLARHFELDTTAPPSSAGRLSVVCGVLGMTAMFDRIAQGAAHADAFSEFLRGIAFNCETLVGRPQKLYLSGGLCENTTFLRCFSSETIPLGRFLLLDGLKASLQN